MLTIYRRHLRDCPHRPLGRKYRRCRCPIWVDGTSKGQEVRESLKTRNWDEAQEKVRDREVNAESKRQAEPLLLETALNDFIADARRRKLANSTLAKYELLFKQMRKFAAKNGLRYLKELDVPTTRKFCETWTQGSLTVVKKLERLRAFFRFCVESRWRDDNPAKVIRLPRVKQRPTLPFTRGEMAKILEACDKYRDSYGRTGQWNAKRLRAFVLLLRYSGLRIGDAAGLARDRIVENRLFLYTQKSGTPVYCPLPQFVIDALNSIESGNQQYFFWSGSSDRDGVARNYMRYLGQLFDLAGIPDGHAHRFRDTFAVEMLLAGTPIERVSILLGHSSVKVTERHYSPWVSERQQQLEGDVQRAWADDPIYAAQTKGTPEGRGPSAGYKPLKSN